MRFASIYLVALALAGATLGGCTTVDSRPANAGGIGQGISYNLPRAHFVLSVVETNGAISVSLSGPKMVADERALLHARLPHNGLSDDNVGIFVDGNNLLTKVEVTSIGRATDIATNLARSFAFLQGAETRNGKVIFQGEFDPTDYAATVQRANEALRGHYVQQCTSGLTAEAQPFQRELTQAGYAANDGNQLLRERLLVCRELARAGLNATRTDLIKLTIDDASTTAIHSEATGARPSTAQCARGICYRPLRPVRFTLSIGDSYALSDTFLMPDLSRIVFVDLSAGIFAQQKYTLTFSDGVLTSYQQDAHSELVGLARLPGEVAGAVIAGTTEALGLRRSEVEAETQYLAAVRANAGERTQTETACRANPNACPGTAYRILRIPLTGRQANPVVTTGPSAGNANNNNNNNGGNAAGNANGGNANGGNANGDDDGIPNGGGR